MNIAVYVRVSTQRQAQAQTIEHQLDSLQTYHEAQGWPWNEENVVRDDGYSGAKLRRPGLDRLRGKSGVPPLTRSSSLLLIDLLATTFTRCSSLKNLSEVGARWSSSIGP
jgi:hypothetical protein